MELKEEDLIPCEDFNFFEARLTALRKSDDLISIELNKIDVNSQAECGNIWKKLTAGTPSPPSLHPRIHEDELLHFLEFAHKPDAELLYWHTDGLLARHRV